MHATHTHRAAWRPDLSDFRDVASAYRITLKSLGRRYLELHDEIADLDVMIGAIVDELAPQLAARNSIGRESAAQLLLTARDNVDRIPSEASFAALCGVSPVPASSGKMTRHRLNRGGDRAANSALHIIAIGRLRTDPRTRAYISRRMADGHSKLEALRCLKRYIAREVYGLIRQRGREIAQTRIVTYTPLNPPSCCARSENSGQFSTRKDARVVDSGGLKNHVSGRIPGFESASWQGGTCGFPVDRG